MAANDESEIGITALLGPTNTGKTHRAIERMLEHESGMIGLPLRLLAREVYDRITARIGERTVALVTGEEKRIPRHPRYWVCTVEAMPTDCDVDFLAVDEIQLGANRERGHVFTDRLLNARGRQETWFLGSEIARSLITRLVPTAKIRSHPRLSQLRGVAASGLSGLPKRTAIVAFSAQRVYELAERIRNKHGGAALVLGALSPRTRNAQVALYQSGEVNYLVATDAIGMGLNLDISHVAFADLVKYDGREARPLEVTEMAQIAGRAGRYLDDGTFGVLAPRRDLAPSIVRALERHQFPAESRLFWRNSQLDVSSIQALIESLRMPPSCRDLRPIEPAEDHRALVALCNRPEICRIAVGEEQIALLWTVCQIPDYRQLLFELHLNLLEEIFLQLAGPRQRLDRDWLESHLSHIDRTEGDIETLMGRIAEIRTWNYVSQHADWVDRELSLPKRARDIEDRLSDALHQKLVARFVGSSRGFSLPVVPTSSKAWSAPKSYPFAQLLAGSHLAQPFSEEPLVAQARWADRLIEASHEDLRIDAAGRLYFDDRRVGHLLAGSDILHPDVQVRLEPDPGRGACARVQRRLLAFTRDTIDHLLAPIRRPSQNRLSRAACGLLYQLERGLGAVCIEACTTQLRELEPQDKRILSGCGIRRGHEYLYLRQLLSDNPVRLRLALASPHFTTQLSDPQRLAQMPLLRIAATHEPTELLTAIGFARCGPILLRIDHYERLITELENCERAGTFNAPRDLSERLACTPDDLCLLLSELGYQRQPDGRWARRAWRSRTATRAGAQPQRRTASGQRPRRRHSPVDSSSDS
jgi:ATP-dependent RNA helicase SUPV3L1/SUV3